MRESKLSPLAGVVFVVLVTGAVAWIGNTSFMPSADEALDMFSNRSGVTGGAYLGALSAFFLLWFSGSLRSFLARAEGGTGRLAALAFGGGVFAAVCLALSFVILPAGAERFATAGGLDPIAATTLNDVSGMILGNAVPLGFAAMLLGTAIGAIRTRCLPAWAGWLSAIIAVGLLSPVNYIVLAGAVLWVAVVAVVLSRRIGTAAEAPQPVPASA